MWIDAQGVVYFGDCRQGDRAATPAEIANWEAARAAAYAQALAKAQIKAVLDSLGCVNIAHFKKDWSLLESERIREVKTEAQAYAENKVYKLFVDAATMLVSLGAEL